MYVHQLGVYYYNMYYIIGRDFKELISIVSAQYNDKNHYKNK